MSADVFTYSALILAGGRGQRMGGQDKGWVRWQGKPLIEHALASVWSQTLPPAEVLISANRHLNEYALTQARVVPDLRSGFEGPLAGVETGLLHARSDWVLVVPCDMPRLPTTLVARLQGGLIGHLAAVASAGEDIHPLCLLAHRSLVKSLSNRLDVGQRSVKAWIRDVDARVLRFEDQAQAFENINVLEVHDGDSTGKHL